MEHPLITTNTGIEGGMPLIKGTRITVEMLADESVAGRTIEQLLYPLMRRKAPGFSHGDG